MDCGVREFLIMQTNEIKVIERERECGNERESERGKKSNQTGW